MKKTATLLLALASLSAAAQDNCANAAPAIIGLTVVGTINGPQVSAPLCAITGPLATAAEWYTYTPVVSHGLTITTDLAINTGGDTRFHVYTGTCGNLTCVAGDDDGGIIGNGFLSFDTLSVTALTTYYIVFDNSWNTNGFTVQLIDSIAGGGTVDPPPGTSPITFSPINVPVSGTAGVADMDGDHLDDVVSVQLTNVRISHQQAGGGFVNTDVTTTSADYMPSWSMAIGDIDDNGQNDLLYGSGSGVTFMKANADATAYTEISGSQYVFSQRSNFVDINNDGHLDAFVCHDVQANVYYLNDGNGNLQFTQGGLGETCGNYGSIWIDYDGDGDVDLFVAKCGCDPVDILYRNNGDGTFTNVAAPLGLADTHNSWSSAWGDFNNDGHLDVVIGTNSTAWQARMLKNNGDGTFTDLSAGSGFDTFDGISNEWTTHDFDNDGYLDVIGGSGGWMHRGLGDFTFETGDMAPSNGPIGDLNNDGFLDILNGGVAYLNDTNDNNWLKVATVGTVSNLNGIGARVTISSSMGTQIRDVKSGDGFRYMSTMNAHFGIGDDEQIYSVTVRWPSGIINVIENPAINSTIVVIEEISTGLADVTTPSDVVYPNPATNQITIGDALPGNQPVRVFDVTGKLVLTASVTARTLNVTSLAPGTYMLQMEQDGRLIQHSFSKR